MPTESELTESTLTDRELTVRLVAIACVLALGIAVIRSTWSHYWALSANERALVGGWVYAESPGSEVVVFREDRQWRIDPGSGSRTASNAISCGIGPRSGTWEMSGQHVFRHAGRFRDVDTVTFVSPNEIRLGPFPYRRVF